MGYKIHRAIFIGRLIENSISCFILVGLVSLSFLNVIMRYFLNAPIPWTEEVLVSGFIWVTFWSIGFCYRTDGLIHIDFIDSMINSQNKKILSYFCDALIFLFSLIILYWSLLFSIQANVKVTNILRIPYRYINFSLFLGILLLDKEIIIKYFVNKEK